jgi:hypothetical protein
MYRKLLISFTLILLCLTAVAAQSGGVTGTWDATLVSPQGTFNVQLILKQDGEKVSGQVKSARGELPLEGTSNGKEIKLKYTIQFQGSDMLITLTGAIDGPSIKGSADYGGLADGEFNAKRAGDSASATATSSPAPAAKKTDLSGAWAFQVETSAGAGSPTFTFKQDGEKLSGQYKGAFGEAPISGTVKDNKIEFAVKIEAQGQQLNLTYKGTVESDGTLKGTVDLGDVGSGTWTGKRQ